MAMNEKLRFLVMDVDGTLTDGKIYIAEYGEYFKAFDVKDGCGIHDILPRLGIVPVIITGGRSQVILANRCRELGIAELHQECTDKLKALMQVLSAHSEKDGEQHSLKNVAYIGDDITDLPCMEQVKASGGIVACPADAVDEVKAVADFVSVRIGGSGAVREFIGFLEKKCL